MFLILQLSYFRWRSGYDEGGVCCRLIMCLDLLYRCRYTHYVYAVGKCSYLMTQRHSHTQIQTLTGRTAWIHTQVSLRNTNTHTPQAGSCLCEHATRKYKFRTACGPLAWSILVFVCVCACLSCLCMSACCWWQTCWHWLYIYNFTRECQVKKKSDKYYNKQNKLK